MFVCNFLIVSKKYMFLFVFVGAKRRSGEISMYQFLISANGEAATFSIQKVPESAGDNGAFPYSICCAKPCL